LDNITRDWVAPCFTRYGKEAPSAPVSFEDNMTTQRPYTRVSRIAITILSIALAACAGSQSRMASYGPAAPAAAQALTFKFDNQGRDHVHVYLIGQRREWLLGRVEPGATARLRLPDDVFDSDPGFVRLAVLSGGGVSQMAARDPRAQLTISQDPSLLLTRRWQFAQGQLTSLGRTAAR
jgi:hypothetical protein